MQAVILAAGRGTRMGDLTKDCPKPMLKALGKNFLEYKIDALPEDIDEVIFVIGYLGDVIKNYFGDSFTNSSGRNFKITYINQEVLDGSMGSLAVCKEILKDKFLVLMGDDIYDAESLREMIKYDNAILGIKNDNQTGGKILADNDGNLSGLKEGMMNSGTGTEYVNCGAYTLDKTIFETDPVLVKVGEYGLPHTIVSRVLSNPNYKVKVVETKNWINITSPESIKEAEEILSK